MSRPGGPVGEPGGEPARWHPDAARPPGGRDARGPAGTTFRRVRRVVVVFFLLYTVAVTWPGMVPFNRIRPLVLGLPLSLVWPALWIVAGCALLFLLEWAWERAAAERGGPLSARPGPPSPGAPRTPHENPNANPAPPGPGPA